MHRLFRLDTSSETGTFKYRQWNYTQTGLRENVAKIIQYYRLYPSRVNSSHVLVRLLYAMNLSRKMSFDRYLANAFDLTNSISQAIGLTTATSKGKLWDGEFYGSYSKEVIIANSDYFDFTNAANEWRDYEPVKILGHNQTNLNLSLPDGKTPSADQGISYISVNVPMLMTQYYYFNLEQDEFEDESAARRTVQQFIVSYPLANAMKSHTDHVLFNRLYAQLKGYPMLDGYSKHSFNMIDYSSAVNEVIEQEIEMLSKSTGRFSALLKMVPLCFSTNLGELGDLPEVPYTMQCMWALMASRVKFIDLLISANSRSKDTSQKDINHIRWLLKTHQVKNAIKYNLGVGNFYDVEPYIAKIEG